jgi:hypothetical protein
LRVDFFGVALRARERVVAFGLDRAFAFGFARA